VKESVPVSPIEEPLGKEPPTDDVEAEEIKEEVKSPSGPISPERVGWGGPYTHMHDHNYATHLPEVCKTITVESIPDIVDVPTESPKKSFAKDYEVPKEKSSKVVASFIPRTSDEERDLLTEFLREGVDYEDLLYLKHCYEMMLSDDTQVTVNSYVDLSSPSRIPVP